MTGAVAIEDDPAHPEGGFARVTFRGLAWRSATVTLAIESLTEGFDYRGPRRLEVPASSTSAGVELMIGPEVVGALKQGLAVNLSVEGTGADYDVLWPALTPPRAAARRSAISSAKPKRRIAVEEAGRVPVAETPVERPEVPRQSTTEPSAEAPRKPVKDTPPPPVETLLPAPESTGAADARSEPPASSDTPTPSDPPTSTPAETKPEKRSGWSLPRVAAVGIAAFGAGAGAGSVALLTFAKPVPVQTSEIKPDLAFPSPYALLADLPLRSPDGTQVKANEASSFRARGQAATSADEAFFWRRWAMRALLNSHTSDAAAVLDDFATTVATSHKADLDIALARFLWELAAVGNDCAAMDNIAAASSMPGAPAATDASDTAAAWQTRAESCRRRAMSER